MKTGKTLTEIAAELERLRANSKDFIAPVSKLRMETDAAEGQAPKPVLTLDNGNGGRHFAPTPWAHSQIAQFADVPKAYYDRLAEQNPGLLAANVNHGLSLQPEARRMVRTAGPALRALVSPKYRRLDSWDLADAILPTMLDRGLDIASSELTDMRLYVKALSPRLTSEVAKGDPVQWGIVVSSSDVGAGSVRVEPFILRLICVNGAIAESAIRTRHLGREQAGDNILELLSDKTRELTDAAYWAQVRDVVIGSLRPELFERQVERLRAARADRIQNFDLPEVVELTAKAVGIATEGTKQSILAYLANGADGAGLNRYALSQALAAAAREESLSYDDAVDLERKAGQVLDLPSASWRRIADAA